jgi:hypothetical protein
MSGKKLLKSALAILTLGLTCTSAPAQTPPAPLLLVPGTPVERKLDGGESHTYQIQLTTGQFVRFRLEQRAINAALVLIAG